MFSAWLKMTHQGDWRLRLGFTLCLFLSSQRVRLFLSVFINVCVGFESVRVEEGVREAPYTQAQRWEYEGRGVGVGGCFCVRNLQDHVEMQRRSSRQRLTVVSSCM